MQQRRAQDVVHVEVTDHLIRRSPVDDGVLLAKLSESRPQVVALELAEPDTVEANEQNLYRAVAAVRSTSGTNKGAVERLELLLTQLEPSHVEPYLDLAMGYLKQRRFADAETTVRNILETRPKHSQAREWLGLSLLGQQRFDDAQSVYDALLAEEPGRPEASFNYGLLLIGKDDYGAAVNRLEQAVTARHNMAPAWYYLGYAHDKLGQLNEAFVSYRKALQIEPAHGRAYVGIARTLVAQGNTQEAIRYLEHGLKSATQIAEIAKELDRIRAGAN
jgi:Flp pilus assembly protein TadD